jgi:hypothetical protein
VPAQQQPNLPDPGRCHRQPGEALSADFHPGSGAPSSDHQQPGLVLPLGGSQPLSEPSWVTVLPDYSSEVAYIDAFDAREWAMLAESKPRLPSYRQSLMRDDADHLLDRTNCGAVAGLDLFVEFFPIGSASGQCNVGHGFQVHVHALLNTPRPLSWEEAQRMYASFCELSSEAGISLYPDLDIRPILTPERYRCWLRYTLKPMKFEEFYARGAMACADRPEAFNNEFDQTVFEGAHTVYGNVKSPRYYGNMQQRKNAERDFIGVWQYPPALNKTEFRDIKDRVERNLPRTGEEDDKFYDHCMYDQQQDEQRRARKARQEARRKRRGGRRASPSDAATTEDGSGGQLEEREGL